MAQNEMDQPRTCGEYRNPEKIMLTIRGSAPHMRGIQSVGKFALNDSRISPAHAGNTCQSKLNGKSRKDQPRTCGEYMMRVTSSAICAGSAPHMRGIPQPISNAVMRTRISPAHAGNTKI